MDQTFDSIVKITECEAVQLGEEVKSLLNKELCLGMTRYVCRHGTLGPGFERITPAQRYYASLREIYSHSNSIMSHKALAMEFQADLLDAQDELEKAITVSQQLRAKAKIMKAERGLMNSLISAEDSLRQLEEFTKVYKELQPIVRAQYPEGIEQAEEDNWKAVAQYRYIKSQTPDLHKVDMTAIPLPVEQLGELGYKFQRPDLMAPQLILDEDKMLKIKENVDRLKLTGGNT